MFGRKNKDHADQGGEAALDRDQIPGPTVSTTHVTQEDHPASGRQTAPRGGAVPGGHPEGSDTETALASMPTEGRLSDVWATTVEAAPEVAAGTMAAADGRATDSQVMSTPAGADEIAFPEPVIIGREPKLRSDPNGLPSGDFTVPDTVLDGADLPGIKIRGASLRGDEHRYFGTTRQDSMAIRRVFDGRTEAYLVCVADGVGSEPLSQRGSAEACKLLYDEVGRRVTPLFTADPRCGLPALSQDMMERVAERLVDMASAWQVAPKSISTTLVGALIEVASEHPAQRRCVAFGIGDSSAFLLRSGIFHPLFVDEHDTVITSTGTSALPTSPGQATVNTWEMVPGDVLMICTDGLSNPMRSDEVKRQLAAWWEAGVPGLPEFGWQLSFRIRSYGDDRTAVCVWGL